MTQVLDPQNADQGGEQVCPVQHCYKLYCYLFYMLNRNDTFCTAFKMEM